MDISDLVLINDEPQSKGFDHCQIWPLKGEEIRPSLKCYLPKVCGMCEMFAKSSNPLLPNTLLSAPFSLRQSERLGSHLCARQLHVFTILVLLPTWENTHSRIL